MNMFFKNFIFLLFLIFCQKLQSQTHLYSLSELDTMKSYTSITDIENNKEKVIKVTLKGKKYSDFPQLLYECPNLQYLSINKANMKKFPDSLHKLPNLQVIDFHKNQISIIPREIQHLKKLKVIRLGQNEINFLPIEIGLLEQLVILDLWSNNITKFPEEISNLKKLKFVDLRVIQMNDLQQEAIRQLIPNVKVEFSQSCNCN
jgi:Leucine-rich repeat (LRR) protein